MNRTEQNRKKQKEQRKSSKTVFRSSPEYNEVVYKITRKLKNVKFISGSDKKKKRGKGKYIATPFGIFYRRWMGPGRLRALRNSISKFGGGSPAG